MPLSIPRVGLNTLRQQIAEKKESREEQLASEDSELSSAGRLLRLKEWISFCYIGPTGFEPRVEWVQLELQDIEKSSPPEKTGYYAGIAGPWDTGEPWACCLWRDSQDRDSVGRETASTDDTIRRTVNNTIEQERIAADRARTRANDAEARADQLESQNRNLRDELALQKRKVEKLEADKREGSGLEQVLSATLLPFVDRAMGMIEEHQNFEAKRLEITTGAMERAYEKKLSAMASKAARAREQIGEMLSAMAEAPAVLRDKNLRRLGASLAEELEDEVDLETDGEEPEAEEATAEVVPEEETAPSEGQPAPAPPPPPETPSPPAARRPFVRPVVASAPSRMVQVRRAEPAEPPSPFDEDEDEDGGEGEDEPEEEDS